VKKTTLITEAGIGDSGLLAGVAVDRIRKVFEVNVFATLELAQLTLRGRIARRRGTVLFVSSIAGRVPMPSLKPYSMSKFALSAASAGLRAELKQLRCNVHVALIEPGAIRTGFNQAVTQRKDAWMGSKSNFAAHVERMQAEEARIFSLLQARSTRSTVAQIVKACEATRPRLRNMAPWIQGLGLRLARIFGV
jgi:short-subunit dehydrogenase